MNTQSTFPGSVWLATSKCGLVYNFIHRLLYYDDEVVIDVDQELCVQDLIQEFRELFEAPLFNLGEKHAATPNVHVFTHILQKRIVNKLER